MTSVRVKTKTGQIMTYQFDSIIDVDGVPFRGTDEMKASHDECKQNFAYLTGRIDQLERIIGNPEEVITGTAVV